MGGKIIRLINAANLRARNIGAKKAVYIFPFSFAFYPLFDEQSHIDGGGDGQADAQKQFEDEMNLDVARSRCRCTVG